MQSFESLQRCSAVYARKFEFSTVWDRISGLECANNLVGPKHCYVGLTILYRSNYQLLIHLFTYLFTYLFTSSDKLGKERS